MSRPCAAQIGVPNKTLISITAHFASFDSMAVPLFEQSLLPLFVENICKVLLLYYYYYYYYYYHHYDYSSCSYY